MTEHNGLGKKHPRAATKAQIAENGEKQPFRELLVSASREICSGDCAKGRNLLRQAAALDMENPEIYNLLGISYEKEGEREKASRFYRVAYYMDQTFSASVENLDRVGKWMYKGFSGVNWGLFGAE